MIDAVKNIELQTKFAPENIKKVAVEVFYSIPRKDFMFYHMAFEGAEIVAVHLLKKNDWFYGIYNGATKTGFLYTGDLLSMEQQLKCFTDYLPDNRNDLQGKIKEFENKIEFHNCTPDSYRTIGRSIHKQFIEQVKK